MNLVFRLALSLLFLISVTTLIGCGDSANKDKDDKKTSGKADDHDHDHDAPESYAAAVKEIKEMRDAVAKAEEGGNLADAHDPLHEVGHVLEAVESLAKKEALDATQLEGVKKAVDDLYDGFGAVDAKLHNDEKNAKTFAEVKDKIDGAISTLESHLKSAESGDEQTDATDKKD